MCIILAGITVSLPLRRSQLRGHRRGPRDRRERLHGLLGYVRGPGTDGVSSAWAWSPLGRVPGRCRAQPSVFKLWPPAMSNHCRPCRRCDRLFCVERVILLSPETSPEWYSVSGGCGVRHGSFFHPAAWRYLLSVVSRPCACPAPVSYTHL